MTATRKLTGLKYAATLVGAASILLVAPATAFAEDNQPTPGGTSGCNYTDADGYNIPLDHGQSVKVDGKTVSCNNGQVTVAHAPKRDVGRLPVFDRGGSVLTIAP